jgi:signal transduction histidine kinase/CheY-like chemotaxis protein
VTNDEHLSGDAPPLPLAAAAAADRIARLEGRLAREKRARLEAETLLEKRSRELFELNTELLQLTQELEQRVLARTAELAGLKEFYERVLDRLPTQLAVLTPLGVYEYANPAEIPDDTLRGWLIGRTDAEYGMRVGLPQEAAAARTARIAAVARDGQSVSYEETIVAGPDDTRYFRRVLAPVFGEAGEVRHLVNAGIDVTAARSVEEQLRRSQKMEAVGLLAGGIAHDFNNLLTIVNGVAETLREELLPTSSSAALFDELLGATQRGAGLTRQLLSFSRRTSIEPQVFDTNDAIRGTESLLRRLLTERIECVLALHDALLVRMDRGGLDQLLLNLAANSRDAMPAGGRFTVLTRAVTLSAESAAAKGLAPGAFAVIEVSDSGTGMAPDVLQRAFEPFYTTKPVGQGSGLGLANVYSIVQQSGGHVEVVSSVGTGTTFRIVLPLVTARETVVAAELSAVTVPNGRGCILVVDDESGVRMVATRLLRRLGYEVIEAGGGLEALRIAEEKRGTIDLLISDVRMPDMNGFDLATTMSAADPSLGVLLMSGYVDDVALSARIASSGIPLLEKPFRSAMLGHVVTDLFSARQAPPAQRHPSIREH